MADNDSALRDAARRGDAERVRRLLAAGANASATDSRGHSALTLAVVGGRAEVTDMLNMHHDDKQNGKLQGETADDAENVAMLHTTIDEPLTTPAPAQREHAPAASDAAINARRGRRDDAFIEDEDDAGDNGDDEANAEPCAIIRRLLGDRAPAVDAAVAVDAAGAARAAEAECCNWSDFVTCDGRGRVTRVRATGGLRGTLPDQLGAIRTLQAIELHEHAALSGTLPSGLTRLRHLQVLQVEQCQRLSGTIPAGVGGSLRRLSLNTNGLSGTLPRLDGMRYLEKVDVDDNQISGTLPRWGGLSTRLSGLFLDNNRISGTLGTEIGQLTALRAVDLAHLPLRGATLPTQLGRLTALMLLDIHQASLEGTLPTQMGRLDSLKKLYVDCNDRLSGSLPTQLGQLAGFQRLYASRTALSGSLPTELANARGLQRLHTDATRLSGAVPPQLCALLAAERPLLRRWTMAAAVSLAACGWSAGALPHVHERMGAPHEEELHKLTQWERYEAPRPPFVF